MTAARKSAPARAGRLRPHPAPAERATSRDAIDRPRAARIFDLLDRQHPNADTELHFRNAYELLVATILSAQCTDARVNQVTPGLFATFPDAQSLAVVEPEVLEPLIQSTGFFRMKSRALVGMARAVVALHHGQIPASMDALVALPGVGRKTANVVLGHALGIPGFPVDRHVLRVAGRIGLSRSSDPVVVERDICAVIEPDRWTRGSDALILHGRRVCRPTPLCDRCQLRSDCAHFQRLGSSARHRPTPSAPRSRRTG
jgi:endonuclease-3